MPRFSPAAIATGDAVRARGAAGMDLSPEFRLFCLALRRPQRPADADALRAAVAAAPDWAAVLAGARRHRVAPLLLAGLQASTRVPADVVAELRRRALADTRKGLAQVAEVGRLQRAFAEAGVRVLFLKGVVLSAQLFGDAAMRGARDIDLLVDPADLPRAETVLAEAGYRSSTPALSPRQAASYRHWIKDVQYVHAVGGTPLELHHRLADSPRLLACEFGALWDGREAVRVGDAAVGTLSRGALALYLCVHGAGHAWERLRWLVDLAVLLREPGCVDAALPAADAAGLGAAMLHAVVLAHDWLGLAVDERHLARARASAQVARLARILARLYAGPAWHEMPERGSLAGMARYSLWARLYRLGLKSDWRYRLDQARREAFTPADFDTVRLPDPLFRLYPLIRPVGWMLRRWRG